MRHDIKQAPSDHVDSISKLKAGRDELDALIKGPSTDSDSIAKLRVIIKSMARVQLALVKVVLRMNKES